MREDSESQFHSLFTETIKLGQQLHGEHFELSTPRIVGRQVHRSNPPVSSAEDNFRITLFDEFLSHVIRELEDRFADNPAHSIALGLLHLLPNECVRVENDGTLPTELVQAADLYSEVLSPLNEFFLVLCRRRCALLVNDISCHFGISKSIVSRIFATWIMFMYFKFKRNECLTTSY